MSITLPNQGLATSDTTMTIKDLSADSDSITTTSSYNSSDREPVSHYQDMLVPELAEYYDTSSLLIDSCEDEILFMQNCFKANFKNQSSINSLVGKQQIL
ncbi:hypothetical protein Droror1_Dr00000317 [Drosera rotundifolia]